MTSTTHKIMFLGPSGAGKTTLLASLYRELPVVLKACGNTTLRCVDAERERELREKVDEVERVEENKLFTFETTLAGTQGLQNYPFELSYQDRALLGFEIIDHKGGDISLSTTDDGVKRELIDSLKEADVLLVVVDAAIMMADPVGIDANRFNQYIAVSDYLRKRLMESERPLLVQFLLTKSERWWRKDVRDLPDRGEALLKKAKESLKPSLTLIEEAASLGKQVMAIIEPVLTLNCVEYSRRAVGVSPMRLEFVRIPRLPYQSQVSMPILRGLAFCLALRLQINNVWWRQLVRKSELEALRHQLRELTLIQDLLIPESERCFGAPELLQGLIQPLIQR